MIYSKYSGKGGGAYQDGGGKVREDRLQQQARHLEIESISHGVWTSFILRLECVYGSRGRKL